MKGSQSSPGLAASVLLALHYQNENCHPDDRIKVGVGPDQEAWRAAMSAAARATPIARGAGRLA